MTNGDLPNNPSNLPVAPKTKLYFGVAVELAGKTISLEPKNAIDELRTKGIEVELPPGERVYLGTAGESLVDIFETLGVDEIGEFLYTEEGPNRGRIKDDLLPDIEPLKRLANIVTSAALYVEEFHVRIPGKGALPAGAEEPPPGSIQNTKESTAYTVALSAEWKDGQGQLINGLDLQLKGLYLKVSNE